MSFMMTQTIPTTRVVTPETAAPATRPGAETPESVTGEMLVTGRKPSNMCCTRAAWFVSAFDWSRRWTARIRAGNLEFLADRRVLQDALEMADQDDDGIRAEIEGLLGALEMIIAETTSRKEVA